MRLADVLVRHGHELTIWAPLQWQAQVEQLGARLEPSSPRLTRRSRGWTRGRVCPRRPKREAERLVPQLHAHAVDVVIRDQPDAVALVAAQYLGIPRIVSHPMFRSSADTPRRLELLSAARCSRPMESGRSDPAERARFAQSWLSIARRWGVELADVRGLGHNTAEPTLTFTTEEIVGDQELPPRVAMHRSAALPPAAAGPERAGRSYTHASAPPRTGGPSCSRIVIAAPGPRARAARHLRGRPKPHAGRSRAACPANFVVRDFRPGPRGAGEGQRSTSRMVAATPFNESLVAGVPLVCLPQAFDQIPLSRRIAQLGVGVIAAEDPGAVRRAVISPARRRSGARARRATVRAPPAV